MGTRLPYDYVILTGGAGFIGYNTMKHLCNIIDKDTIIIVIDRNKRLSSLNVNNCSNVIKVIVDITRFENLASLVHHIHGSYVGILHFAAIADVNKVRENPVEGFNSNVVGTFNILDIARRLDAKMFVYASSAAVYGEPRYLPLDEEHPTNPINFYGSTKLAGEDIARGFAEEYGLTTVILRYFNVYGPGMENSAYAGVVYRFIESLLLNRKPVIFGDGNQTRDFVHVEDVVSANVAALMHNKGGVYNIGSGVAVSINDLYNLICKLMIKFNIINKCPTPRYESARPGDIRHSVAKIDRAIKELMWMPRISLEEGLRKTISYYCRLLRGMSCEK